MKKCGQELKEYKTNEVLQSTDVQMSNDKNDVVTLPRVEVIQRLRDRGEPILFFGESELEAFKRLRKCEILEPEVNRVNIIINLFLFLCFKCIVLGLS